MSRTLTLVALILALSGCGGSDSESSETTDSATMVEETQSTETIVSADVLGCLEQAGLSGVEESDVDTWHGFHNGSSYAIVVHKLATPAKAPAVVAGEYALTGPFKVAAVGEGLTVGEGLQADALVQEVAACLGG